MPYETPADEALSAAYDKIADQADAFPATVIEPTVALARADRVLWLYTNRVSALLQSNVIGPWGDQLIELRDLAVEYAGLVVATLRTATASGAILGVVSPTRDRLAAMVDDYSHGYDGSTHIEEYGEDEDQTLIGQFAMPLMHRGSRFPGGSRSEDELIRDSFGVVGAAARLIAAIEERPPLHREWDD